MDTSKFVKAVRNQDTSELVGPDKKLADDLLTALSKTSTEFHGDMLHLLGSLSEGNDLAELVAIVNFLEPQQRIQLIAIVTTGDATEDFMRSLDTNPKLQRAVDIAFAGHVGQLHDLGEALNNAKDSIEDEKKDENTNS